jgi:hypothetical protein
LNYSASVGYLAYKGVALVTTDGRIIAAAASMIENPLMAEALKVEAEVNSALEQFYVFGLGGRFELVDGPPWEEGKEKDGLGKGSI